MTSGLYQNNTSSPYYTKFKDSSDKGCPLMGHCPHYKPGIDHSSDSININKCPHFSKAKELSSSPCTCGVDCKCKSGGNFDGSCGCIKDGKDCGCLKDSGDKSTCPHSGKKGAEGATCPYSGKKLEDAETCGCSKDSGDKSTCAHSGKQEAEGASCPYSGKKLGDGEACPYASKSTPDDDKEVQDHNEL